MIRALIYIGYLSGLTGLKSARKAFREAISYSEVLPKELRDQIIGEAVDYLLSLGNLEDALFYAVEISEKKLRNTKLLEILSRTLEELEKKDINPIYKRRKIELILEHIEDEPYRSEAIVKVIRPLLLLGSYERTIELIRDIKSKHWLKQALNELLLFLRSGKGEGVEGIIELSRDLAKRSGRDIKEDLAYIFAIHGFINQSVEILESLPNREDIAREIFDNLALKDLKQLQAFIEALPPEIVDEIREKIIEIMEEGDERFSSIVKTITEKTSNEEILIGAVKYFLRLDEFEEVVPLLRRIRTEKGKSIALGFIAYHLINKGRIGDAIDIVLEIKDRNLASKLASEILIKAVEREIYERIANEKKERKRNDQFSN